MAFAEKLWSEKKDLPCILSAAKEDLGLDNASLESMAKSIIQRRGTELGEYLPISSYSPLVSFLTSYFGCDLSGRTIVEVGNGVDGAHILDMFASLGANAIGLDYDPSISSRIPLYLEVDQRKGFWEDIAHHVGEADAVYVEFMYPEPQDFLKSQLQEMPSCLMKDDVLYRYKDAGAAAYRRKFESHIAEEMRRVLVDGGLFLVREGDISWQGYADFTVRHPDLFQEAGYIYRPFGLQDMQFGKTLHAFQKF